MTIEQKRIAHGAWSLIGIAAAALALAGCGGSGGGSAGMTTNSTVTPSACADCGTLMVGLTDADGDFVSYSVDVLSLKLQRANGAQVETLPQTTRVDFAQLTDLSDLLSVASLAPESSQRLLSPASASSVPLLRRLVDSLKSLIGLSTSSVTPVLLCPSPARYHVKRWLEPLMPRLAVIAAAEIPPEIRLKPSGTVR